MTGIISILPHLITIALLWVAIIVVVQLIKHATFRVLRKEDKFKQHQKRINKTVFYVNTGATTLALAIVLLIMIFLYNPTERSYEEMNKIGTIVPEVIKPTKDEIKASNKEVMESKSKQKEKEAEQDNIEAMEKAEKLFRKAQEQADNN